MTKEHLEALAAKHGLAIDPGHAGAGKYRDLEVGCGASHESLHAFIREARSEGLTALLRGVDNKEHPQHGQNYVELPSFWWE